MSNEGLSAKKQNLLRIIGIILAISIVIFNANSILGLLTTVLPIGTSGMVASAGIECYMDINCQNELSSINWGLLSPGDSSVYTVYIKNSGNTPLDLSFATISWNPQNAASYFTLSWDYSGTKLQPDEALPITFTLVVSSSIQGIDGFGFDISITGTEAS